MNPEYLVIVTDDPQARSALDSYGAAHGRHVIATADHSVALQALARDRCRMVFVDVRVSGGGWAAFLDALECRGAIPPLVLLSDPEHLAESFRIAQRKRVFDCALVPIIDEQIERLLACARRWQRVSQRLGDRRPADERLEIIGSSKAAVDLRQFIRQSAPTEATVLIEGEAGAGKRLVAQLLHQESRRADGPFITIDCAALSPERIESELFGAMHGVGGLDWRPAALDLAEGGTLLLHEVGACPMPVQGKILRLLTDGQWDDSSAPPANVRCIATTSCSLERLAAKNEFRPDLFYRLSVLHLRVPSLRERREDILPLIGYFLSRHARRAGRSVLECSSACLKTLVRHDWPGNVLELRLTIEGAALRCSGSTVEPQYLAPRLPQREAPPPDAPSSFDDTGNCLTLAEVEKRHILASLAYFRGNRTATARSLDISIRTLRNKLHEYRPAANPATEASERAA